ncbi:MAG: hypothetical protein AUJ28_02840 [Parcubacteria group bacterium CG1_02_37_51]|uniref:Uncharacterized protein n=2 Tax=Candidatus Komeiliibacteriota TaxID=1817908 RepID=A0A2M8DQT8_9BACT|nr:MAG: hypothetical protein AUJ28_02840 [Parcubacteria group bacterium CG1_02_37_51]PIY95160.1 MAG: hypothetical protein COY67_01410 [Candidatus Komeilibacteria bacterium CG_4_10_14_0_8_um_filter_37_78]PJC01721.1 MAG: hypothetical protein CO073_03040 [Candidatus Komeilibacteria bacterium CG_4_9_14_0_8_um_filter_36_9]
MINREQAIYAIRYLLFDLVKEILYFPIWWYSRGLIKATIFCGRQIKSGNERFAITILFRYWFKPMYGQQDWQGKIISFFIRTIHLAWRLLLMAIWLIIVLLIFIIYLVLPIYIICELIPNCEAVESIIKFISSWQ